MIEPAPIAFRRCFVAWMLPPSAVEQVDSCRHAWTWPAAAKPILGTDLHVTLHYLGNLDADRVTSLRRALGDMAIDHAEVCLDRAEIWNDDVAVLCGDATPRMAAMHDAVGRAVATADCALGDKRQWRPHVTLARSARHATPPPSPVPVRWRTTGIVLAAAADGGPARYQIIDAWPPTDPRLGSTPYHPQRQKLTSPIENGAAMVDAQAWMAECAATLIAEHCLGPRCGPDDVLNEEDAMRLAGDLMEDSAYRNLPPREAAEAFIKHSA